MRGWTAAGRCSSVSPPALPLQACSSPAACIGSVWFAEGLGSCAAGSQCNSPFACASCQALNHQAAEQPRAAALQGPPPFRLASVKWAFPRLNSCRTKVYCPPLLHSIPLTAAASLPPVACAVSLAAANNKGIDLTTSSDPTRWLVSVYFALTTVATIGGFGGPGGGASASRGSTGV